MRGVGCFSGSSRAIRARAPGLAVGAALAVILGLTVGGGASAQDSDRERPWVLVDTLVNPDGELAPANWDVTMSASSMTVRQTFGPDDTSGAEAVFEASWTPPPDTLEPRQPLVIPVTVSARNTGNLDTQYFFGLDVIMVVDGSWNRQAVGAGANCAQTTVISGVYKCTDPVTNSGEMQTIVTDWGEEYSVSVGALNCSGACRVTWSYERGPVAAAEVAAGAATSDATGEGSDGSDSSIGDGSLTDESAGADGEGDDDSGGATGAVIATVLLAGAVAAGVVSIRRATRGGDGSDGGEVDDDEEDDDEPREVLLELTYPAGKSPYVFQRGWLFGARAIVAPGTPDERDVSDTVRWSGDAAFDPPVGRQSRPAFIHGDPLRDMLRQRASKRITLQVEVDGVTTETTTTVGVTGTLEYSRLGDTSVCPADAHACPACPHSTQGPISAGSPTVLLNGKPAARVGDPGIHSACCGPNNYTIVSGDESVLIDGRPAAHKGSATTHCGGTGSIVMGSPD